PWSIYPLLPDRLARTLAGAGVGTGTLATQRQAATVAQAAVAAQVHQTLDGDADFATKVALDDVLADLGAQALDLRLGQVTDLGRRGHVGGLANLLRPGAADAIDALQPHPHVLVGRQVDACNTRHDAISKLEGRGAPGRTRQEWFKSELRILSMSRIAWKSKALRP